MDLSVGDLILTEKAASAPLSLLVEGKRKFIGHLGEFKGNRVFKVNQVYRSRNRV